MLWDENHNLQDNFPWVFDYNFLWNFIKWLPWFVEMTAIVMLKKKHSSFKWNNYNIICLPSVNNLGLLIK